MKFTISTITKCYYHHNIFKLFLQYTDKISEIDHYRICSTPDIGELTVILLINRSATNLWQFRGQIKKPAHNLL